MLWSLLENERKVGLENYECFLEECDRIVADEQYYLYFPHKSTLEELNLKPRTKKKLIIILKKNHFYILSCIRERSQKLFTKAFGR